MRCGGGMNVGELHLPLLLDVLISTPPNGKVTSYGTYIIDIFAMLPFIDGCPSLMQVFLETFLILPLELRKDDNKRLRIVC